MITRSEAIPRFLQRQDSIFADKYRHGFEVQVLTYDNNEVNCLEKGRPYNTCDKDGFTYIGNKIQSYPLDLFADLIGFSGWNPLESKSYGVGFDFDAVAGHATTGTRNLKEVQAAVSKLPYVEIVRSKSGTGLHLWVWLAEPIETKSRTQHKAVARSILSKMSLDSGYHLDGSVDVFGGNMWIWSKDANDENQGHCLIKKGALLEDVPDWRPHLDVVKGKRKRVAICDGEPDFDYPRERLDTEHRRVIDDLYKTGFHTSWNEDHGCLVTHAHALGQIESKGIYETDSPGNSPTDPNAFIFPAPNGAWRVYRFGTGCSEAKTWDTSGEWTHCDFNSTPTLEVMAKVCGATKLPSTTMEGIIFSDIESATYALKAYGVAVDFPSFAQGRDIALKIVKGKTILDFQRIDLDDAHEARSKGWSKQRGTWAQSIKIESEPAKPDYAAMSRSRVRYVSKDGKGENSYVMTDRGCWESRPEGKVRDQLAYWGIRGGLQQDLLGWCSEHPYRLESIPFAPEYPGERIWNRDSAQLKFPPADRPGPTPHWDKVLSHLGAGLDSAVADNDLCQTLGIETGQQYLERWIANAIREPHRRLPILALFSPEQDTGKSTLHEALDTLLTAKGVEQADKALSNDRGFNIELKGVPFCVIEETNLAKYQDAYNRLKAWNTNLTLSYEEKRESVFKFRNYMHFLICVNHRHYIPIEPGDTRFVLWRVARIKPGDMIPKPILMDHLVKEGPFFLHRLFQLDIENIVDRHTLPVLSTLEKQEAMDDARFIDFPLKGLQRKLAEAIASLDKPLDASAAELNDRLGNWDGQLGKRTDHARIISLGMNIKHVQPFLPDYFQTKIEIDDSRKVNHYKILQA